jgi:hypothetical protein
VSSILTPCVGLGCLSLCFCALGSEQPATGNRGRSNAELIEALNQVVSGPRVGPSMGIRANAATRAVVKRGPGIVPDLIYALDHSSWRQSVWIVFCLTELRASSARERILQLREEIDQGRFDSEPRDLTLDAGIRGYLRKEAHARAFEARIRELSHEKTGEDEAARNEQRNDVTEGYRLKHGNPLEGELLEGGMIIGAGLAVFGFLLWCEKKQKPDDESLQHKLAERRASVENRPAYTPR